MYYITNYNDQIIAADESLLQSLQVQDVDNLIKKVLLEEISFNKNRSNELQVVTQTDTYSYSMNHVTLSSMLGNLNLIHLETIEEKSTEIKDFITEEDSSTGSIVENIIQETDEEIKLESEPVSLLDAEEDTLITSSNEESVHEEELFDLSLPSGVIPSSVTNLNDTIQTPEIDDSELFDLTLPETPIESVDNITLDSNDITESLPSSLDISEQSEDFDTSPIIININEVSENIGISDEDYKTFLNDYIDTAISLEDELQSEDENERLSAMGTLTQLADVLQLPKVNTIIQQISTVPQGELSNLVESFYQTLSRLTTEETATSALENSLSEVAPNLDETEHISIEKETKQTTPGNGFGKIYLEDVNPIHFDFQLESAASDLSLPVELIEEFVHDFIEQGHIETKKMLLAYEEGDLDTIQKIGHLLKGASSNLRINALSDTLYDIQFCEDSNKLEDLIERYWAHFISFEQHIDMITKQ